MNPLVGAPCTECGSEYDHVHVVWPSGAVVGVPRDRRPRDVAPHGVPSEGARIPLDHPGFDRLEDEMDDPDDLYYVDSAWDFESGNPREGW